MNKENTMSENNENKRKAGTIAGVVQWVILGMSCLLLCWTAKQVIEDGKIQAAHSTTLESHTTRIAAIEGAGSGGLKEHVKLDDERVSELKRRMEEVEKMMIVVTDIRLKIVEINSKLDQLVKPSRP